MAIATTANFMESVRQSGVLDAAQLKQLTPKVLARASDARDLARALVKKGWLTQFQVNQLLQDKPQDLVLDQYLILDRIGEGGMGSVYRARHRVMGREVALKVIRKDRLDNPDAIRRFQREISAA